MQVLKCFRQRPRQHDAILDRETRARRPLRPIGQHQPTSVGSPDQFARIQMQKDAARRRQPVAGQQEAGLAKHQLGRDQAPAKQFLRPVQIREHPVQQLGSLCQAGGQFPPFLSRQQPGNRIEFPVPVAILRRTGEAMVDAVFPQQPPHPLEVLAAVLRAQLLQPLHELVPRAAPAAVRRAQLVVRAPRCVARQQAFRRAAHRARTSDLIVEASL